MKCSFKIVGVLIIAIVFAVACSVAFAEEIYVPQIKEKAYEGIPYISGGVGQEERDALAVKSKDYNLKILFAAKSGEYRADIKVEIADSRGKKVLVAAADGPWFFTNLPAGKYTVTATMKDSAKSSKVNIVKGKKQITAGFYW